MPDRRSLTHNRLTSDYESLLREYQWADEAFTHEDGDFDLLWLRFQAARRALDVYISNLKSDQSLPVHHYQPIWPWWRLSRSTKRPPTIAKVNKVG
jgi:hypothetical protein